MIRSWWLKDRPGETVIVGLDPVHGMLPPLLALQFFGAMVLDVSWWWGVAAAGVAVLFGLGLGFRISVRREETSLKFTWFGIHYRKWVLAAGASFGVYESFGARGPEGVCVMAGGKERVFGPGSDLFGKRGAASCLALHRAIEQAIQRHQSSECRIDSRS